MDVLGICEFVRKLIVFFFRYTGMQEKAVAEKYNLILQVLQKT